MNLIELIKRLWSEKIVKDIDEEKDNEAQLKNMRG